MTTTYIETSNFNINPPMEELELMCPFCKSWIDVDLEDNLIVAFGCYKCGADLTVTGKIIIEGKAQN